ncbi:DUF4136 domain-containing protein [Pseudomonas sp. HR96]|uniref:DUF4136 domain-containing protein n=1 Tax=Pseudomonas sp. HR96 TaxID=1027966 RepID=UPI002A759831|nr:DUF4136 domain-containing protein [Pseudomonas sp. HR96]WPP00503.1 DUF4136 domain-containing protein [Pseudomonas sp. HR96]
MTLPARIALTLSLSLLLGACQAYRPVADYDASRDFAGYRTWAFKDPVLQYRPDDPRIRSDLTEQRIRQAVSEQLDQRGLRPAPAGSKADLDVQTWWIVDNRQQQIVSQPPLWGGYWGGGWGAPIYTETRTIDYKVATVQIDLLDGRDGKLVWRASAEHIDNSGDAGPQQRSDTIRKSVAEVLSSYPPH